MTRILREVVACPQCGHLQTASVMYSWNERFSGPYSEERFRIACENCAESFIPNHSDVRRDLKPERRGLLQWLFGRTR